jgi:importin subunit alpha-2
LSSQTRYSLSLFNLLSLLNVQNPDSPRLLKNVVWVVSNFCRGKPPPELNLVKDCIPAMVFATDHAMSSDDARLDALWAFSYLTDGDNGRIQACIDYPVVAIAMAALQSGKSFFVLPALRILGNVVTGSDKQTQTVLDAGILETILVYLQHSKVRVHCFTCACSFVSLLSFTLISLTL